MKFVILKTIIAFVIICATSVSNENACEPDIRTYRSTDSILTTSILFVTVTSFINYKKKFG
jgi:hypothetical protein